MLNGEENMINSWTGFQPLREVWLGDVWPVGWEKFILKDPVQQEKLRNIIIQTQEQLNTFQRIMEDDGIRVRRPCMPGPEKVFEMWQKPRGYDYWTYVRDYFEQELFKGHYIEAVGNYEKFQKEMQMCFEEITDQSLLPELNPRDNFLVYGNTMWVYHDYAKAMAWWGDTLDEYVSAGFDVRFPAQQKQYMGVVPPSIVRLGKDVIIENTPHPVYSLQDHTGNKIMAKAMRNQYNARVYESGYVDGRHSDGQFAVLRPGVAMTSQVRGDRYQDSLPGWRVIRHVTPEFHRLSQEEKDEIFSMRFVNKQIEPWIGNITESFFDVNCLVRDEGHVYVSSDPPKDLGSIYTVIPWRYRFFWDGGLHCITLDINREGKQEDYFDSKIN